MAPAFLRSPKAVQMSYLPTRDIAGFRGPATAAAPPSRAGRARCGLGTSAEVAALRSSRWTRLLGIARALTDDDHDPSQWLPPEFVRRVAGSPPTQPLTHGSNADAVQASATQPARAALPDEAEHSCTGNTQFGAQWPLPDTLRGDASAPLRNCADSTGITVNQADPGRDPQLRANLSRPSMEQLRKDLEWIRTLYDQILTLPSLEGSAPPPASKLNSGAAALRTAEQEKLRLETLLQIKSEESAILDRMLQLLTEEATATIQQLQLQQQASRPKGPVPSSTASHDSSAHQMQGQIAAARKAVKRLQKRALECDGRLTSLLLQQQCQQQSMQRIDERLQQIDEANRSLAAKQAEDGVRLRQQLAKQWKQYVGEEEYDASTDDEWMYGSGGAGGASKGVSSGGRRRARRYRPGK